MNKLFYIIIGVFIFISCTDEQYTVTQQEGYITLRNISRIFDPSNPTNPGTIPDDYTVSSFRVLAFETTGSKQCKDNVLYIGSAVTEVIYHPIKMGTYNFVFLANEPSFSDIKSQLDNIQSYADLQKLSYPISAFELHSSIPMIAENDDIVILANGKFKIDGENTEQTILDTDFRRLAVRLDVTLLSEMPLENADPALSAFKGITLSNLPDKVPLVWGLPSGRPAQNAEYTDPALSFNGDTPVEWDLSQKQTFTLANNDFESDPLTPAEEAEGYKWKRTIKRIVLPASYFTTKNKKEKAVIITVNTKEYNPSRELEIKTNDYTLPANALLEFKGIVKEPLEVNIKASDWSRSYQDWETDQLYLNLSTTEVNITDFNGARITFESNAPVIRVEGLADGNDNIYIWANEDFNQLQWTNDWNSKIKYIYDPATQTGTGYMDIILGNVATTSGSYKLVLTARRKESWEAPGGLVLARQIKVNVKKEGNRQTFDVASDEKPYDGFSYIGAFYRNEQVGERIIQNIFSGGWWEVTVPDETIPGSGRPVDWILVSSTPSSDPNVGTSNPGNAEYYPVTPNYYKGEDGTKVTGKGRLYYRIGLRSKHTNTKPRYGYVNMRYILGQLADENNPPTKEATQVAISGGGYEQIKTLKIYIRQGQGADEILTEGTPAAGTSLKRAAVKFSPYNVTVQEMIDTYNSTNNYIQAYNNGLGSTNLVDVEYPTQAGAIFQWGAPTTDYRLYAYYPRGLVENEFENFGTIPNNVWGGQLHYPFDPFWVAPASSTEASFKDLVEVCPPGYRRPNNGALSELAKNRSIDAVVRSEFLSSLFNEIPVGDGHTNIPDEYLYPTDPNGIIQYKPKKSITNLKSGFYADGFFDRHPIKDNYSDYPIPGTDKRAFGVSLSNARAAYNGVLFFNPDTYASVFFPNAGRRDASKGYLQYRGASGYYITASLGNQWIPENEIHTFTTAWQIELEFKPAPVSATISFGASMRCVKD